MTAIPRSFYVGLTFNDPDDSPRSLSTVDTLLGSSAHSQTTDNERTPLSVETVAAQFEGRLRRFRGAGRK
jgi:hypothetical protein